MGPKSNSLQSIEINFSSIVSIRLYLDDRERFEKITNRNVVDGDFWTATSYRHTKNQSRDEKNLNFRNGITLFFFSLFSIFANLFRFSCDHFEWSFLMLINSSFFLFAPFFQWSNPHYYGLLIWNDKKNWTFVSPLPRKKKMIARFTIISSLRCARFTQR